MRQDNLRREMVQAEITKLSEKKYSEEVSLSKIDSELEYMQQRVAEEYNVTYEDALPTADPEYDITVSAQEISRLKKKINSLGSVNPTAIEDFEVLDARYQDMVVQRDDLLKAEDDLKHVINDLTKEILCGFRQNQSELLQNIQGTVRRRICGSYSRTRRNGRSARTGR